MLRLETELAPILPKLESVIHSIYESISPIIRIVNVFSECTSSSELTTLRNALKVNLYSFVTADWYGTLPAISPENKSNFMPGGNFDAVPSGLVSNNS